MTVSVKRTKRIWKDAWNVLPKNLILKMVRTQIQIEIDDISSLDAIIEWCNENCNGLFRYSDNIFYFEEESDMTAFKIMWDGKEEND